MSENLLNKQVLSLRTGSPVATVISTIINPDNLKIEGFYCTDKFRKGDLILLTQDIRDASAKGYFVNDHEVLSEPHELVRLKQVLDIGFNPVGKQVVTVSKTKVGKVSDYAYDSNSMYIQKIYVSQNILKSFTGGSLSIDRTLIQEITPKKIIISDLPNKSKMPVGAAVPNTL